MPGVFIFSSTAGTILFSTFDNISVIGVLVSKPLSAKISATVFILFSAMHVTPLHPT